MDSTANQHNLDAQPYRQPKQRAKFDNHRTIMPAHDTGPGRQPDHTVPQRSAKRTEYPTTDSPLRNPHYPPRSHTRVRSANKRSENVIPTNSTKPNSRHPNDQRKNTTNIREHQTTTTDISIVLHQKLAQLPHDEHKKQKRANDRIFHQTRQQRYKPASPRTTAQKQNTNTHNRTRDPKQDHQKTTEREIINQHPDNNAQQIFHPPNNRQHNAHTNIRNPKESNYRNINRRPNKSRSKISSKPTQRRQISSKH